MSKSDRHSKRRDQVRGRENKKTKGPEIEVPKAIVQEAVNQLKRGNTILYPTDTIYGIGCDATNYEAVEKIYEIKERDPSKSLLILVDSFPMLDQYIEEVPDMAWEVLKVNKDPLTIIYDRPKSVAENLIASDNSLAIRVTNDPLCRAIIRGLRKPIVSTSANISGQPAPVHFEDISEDLKQRVDHIVDLPLPAKNIKPSAIMKISNNGVIKVIRK
ncbi:L-threonylcarbamoyladenylate synthase [Nonlabens sp. Hel1_33_55]|uniref:L-threonylcarbamoyladenylate synthase n=1 Tax=Nonlabens sp. Hel1_33_55 TaxID=1336802 RepID=UPI000875DF15|nr:L-threonylcarbamoyladenylate synthase [Nonlabens sp. Hel1_33_55]SCX89429.1 L-threonylcarbamoyladenylate synthase [Nonlabens sp. Hel1_33_55]